MHERERILAYVEIEDLQPDLREVARRVGIDVIRALLLDLEGQRITFRPYHTLAVIRRRYACAHYRRAEDGSDNLLAIARELGVARETVRGYLRSMLLNGKCANGRIKR